MFYCLYLAMDGLVHFNVDQKSEMAATAGENISKELNGFKKYMSGDQLNHICSSVFIVCLYSYCHWRYTYQKEETIVWTELTPSHFVPVPI